MEGCSFETDDVEASVAAVMLTIHNNVHIANPTPGTSDVVARQRAPKIERPKISTGSSEETWNTFLKRWTIFQRSTGVTGAESVEQLFHCCDEDLGDSILNGHPDAVTSTVDNLLKVIKRMAVIPVAISVRRADLLATKQDHGENARAFYAKVRGKASTCKYSIECTSTECNQTIDFTDVMVKDVIISGLVDEDVKKDVLGWTDLDDKSLEDTVSFVEAKEMARDALSKGPTNAGISTYKKGKPEGNSAGKIPCKLCKAEIDRIVWNKRQRRNIECTLCLPCWKKSNPRKDKSPKDDKMTDETGALVLIGGISSVTAVSDLESSGISSHGRKEIVLDHHIFNSQDGWKKSESMPHPTLKLVLTTDASDYEYIGVGCPQITPSTVSAVTDTGAQSALWGLQGFYRCGFKDSDLLPVKRTMRAANMEEIEISGAIFVRLTGTDSSGKKHTAPIMTYISPSTEKFYLSREALVQLGVIPKDFPKVGATLESSAIEAQTAPCGCMTRSLPPERPKKLPFPARPENINKMKEWLGERYASSTWNKCTHQVLKGVTGPPLKLHVDPDANPKSVHVPSKVPLHWEKQIEEQLLEDVRMGVLERVPHGVPTEWCHRMVVTRKPNGKPRRTVDMSALNKVSRRETHHVKPPFHQAKSIPPHTWKTVTDAWNGYHCVPLAEEDREYTTFITSLGRFRYRMAPQGALGSGDGYSRRFDEVIADVERKTKCVDDTCEWDDELETHWWRTIDFLDLLGLNGIVLNFDKFQFSQREVEFAGFLITETGIKPLDKYLRAISEFPTPMSTTDIRAWFGLVHQVSHYNKLTEMLEPFKPFLSPKVKFKWTVELNEAFEKSKLEIVRAIENGVEIYDPAKVTCLRPDWSKKGIGYFLSQKHCECDSFIPGCCEFGWRITLAGSRFLKPAETRYAPVEGEALAIAWSLKHTKHFTQGQDKLTVVTDHKPLVKLFGDRALDQIDNPRLFSLKQCTLPWRFSVVHMPGIDNCFSDATSRNPVDSDDEKEISNTEILAGIMVDEINYIDNVDMATICTINDNEFRAITWDIVRQETQGDESLRNLSILINSSFPEDKSDMPPELMPYWSIRDNLYMIDGVILMNDQVLLPSPLREDAAKSLVNGTGTRILIPPRLRPEILQSLHSAHQGVGSMTERAKAGVYWPGITKDIESARTNCTSCNRIMPSQARLPPIEPWIPSMPFEAIACDYFQLIGNYYFVAVDRLSGWLEVMQIRVGTNEAGAQGLCKALRRIMITFGVPIEVSSDGGPEFSAGKTKAFLKKWGIRHRLSSVAFPSSNGRAELAVKTAKRMLMDNISPNGSLDNDGMVRALLMYRNTPDPGCKLSPAQILLGRPLRDTLPFISKDIMVFNNREITSHWKDAWNAKEEALKARYVKTLENMSEHSRPLLPLEPGNHVMIQNQIGRYPNKWDKSGVVVETKENDQYVVKVAGSGRLTLRNRRFLRKYGPHYKQAPEWGVEHGNHSGIVAPDGNILQPPAPAETKGMVETHQVSPVPLTATGSGEMQQGSSSYAPHQAPAPFAREMLVKTDRPSPVLPVSIGSDGTQHSSPSHVPQQAPALHERSLNPPASIGPDGLHTRSLPATSPTAARRSTRERKQRQLYDASTGEYGAPHAVTFK